MQSKIAQKSIGWTLNARLLYLFFDLEDVIKEFQLSVKNYLEKKDSTWHIKR